MRLIELKDIFYTYPDGTHALRGISLSIDKGKKIAILGSNGSGKSTLFLLLNGIYKHDSGSYYFNGEEITHSKKQKRMLIENIGLVFQDPEIQIFASTVYQEISIGPKNLGCSDEETAARIGYAMDKADVTHLSARQTHFLSYGEKKRVAIADILAMKSGIIILDEPLAGLDKRHENEMIGILESLSQENRTVIMSTHSPDIAYEWADYIYVLSNGEVICEGEPFSVFSNKETVTAAGLEVPYILRVAEKSRLKRLPINRTDLLTLLEEA